MFGMQGKHFALLAGFLAATATVIAGLDTWADATKPAVVAGFLGQLGTLVGSIFVEKPQPQ